MAVTSGITRALGIQSFEVARRRRDRGEGVRGSGLVLGAKRSRTPVLSCGRPRPWSTAYMRQYRSEERVDVPTAMDHA